MQATSIGDLGVRTSGEWVEKRDPESIFGEISRIFQERDDISIEANLQIGNGGQEIEFQLDGCQSKYNFDKVQMHVRGRGKIVLKNCNFRNLIILETARVVIEFENCVIGQLNYVERKSGPSRSSGPKRTNIINSYIDTLRFESDVMSFKSEKAIVSNLEIRAPSENNPFIGHVEFSGVDFLLRGNQEKTTNLQAFRNARHHCDQLNNKIESFRFAEMEMRIERKIQGIFVSLIYYLYQIVSGYGNRPGRTILWLFAIQATAIISISYLDGLSPTCLSECATDHRFLGVRSNLLAEDFWGSVFRAIWYSIGGIFNPLGIFGSRQLLVANSALVGGIHLASVILSVVVFIAFIAAVRRKLRVSSN